MTTIIGIDAEWQTNLEEEQNDVLSYQWFGLDGEREWAGVHYPEDDKRLTISDWLSLALMEDYKNRAWPRTVVLASHFTTAELSVIKNFDTLKTRLDLVQGSSYASARQPFTTNCYDNSRNRHPVTVHLLDTMLLAPADGRSLAALGELLGFPKEELPKGHTKDQMRRFMDEEPELFQTYALRDAEITARYIRRVEEECSGLGLDNYRPVTVGGLAVRTFIRKLEENGQSYDSIMGTAQSSTREGRGRSSFTSNTRVYQNRLAERHEKLAIDSYHGGRNECFLFGFHEGIFTDYDLEGAYSTALAGVVEPDFENLKETTDPSDFTLDQMGFALVSWKFPRETRFPCLFQRDPSGHGLIYVLEGQEYLTSPEIDLARRMGADLTIHSGVVIPSKEDGIRPFLGISQWVNSQRKKFPKKQYPFENAFYKLIGNNVYGKVAQGLRNTSRVFDSRLGSTTQLERSRISDAYAAAYTTGLVRATTSEILSLLPSDVMVGNTITDGVCTTATEDQMEQATRGPQCQFFSALREMICSDPKILDIKGQVDGMVFMRTRMHASTGNILKGAEPILAKVNVPMGHLRTEDDEALSEQEKNDILIEEFLARDWDREWKSRTLTSARKLYETGGDLLEEETTKFLGMDYDFKRKPLKPTTMRQHLAFQTSPWFNHAEYAKCRKTFDQFKEPLRSTLDLDVLFQEVDTKGTKKNRTRGKRRKIVYANDLRDRMAVGADGLLTEDGERLKPREVDEILRTITDGEVGATGDQLRKTRSRVQKGEKELGSEYIEVTTTVSAADMIIKGKFAHYTGEALKREEVSSIRVNPKEEEGQS